jgi:hypothetical protein
MVQQVASKKETEMVTGDISSAAGGAFPYRINRLAGLAAAGTLLTFASAFYAERSNAALDSVTAAATPELRARMVARFTLRNVRAQASSLTEGTHRAADFGPLPPFSVHGVRASSTVTVEPLAHGTKKVTVAVRWYDGAPRRTGTVKMSDILSPRGSDDESSAARPGG